MCGIYLIYIHAYTRSNVKTESGKVESDSVVLVLSVYNPQGATFFRAACDLLLQTCLCLVTLPALVVRDPHGINFVYASCDLSLLVLAMFDY